MAKSSSISRPSSAASVERAQWSTVASDGVLAFLTLHATATLAREAYRNFDDYSPRGDSIGTWQSCVCLALGLVGVAAGAGTFRFAGIGPIRPIHEFLAALAMYVSMPLIGLASVMAFSSVSNPTIPVSAVVGLVGVFLAFRRFPRQLQQPYQETYVLLTSLFGVLCALFRSLFILAGRSGSLSAESRTAAWYGLGGTLLIMLAGAVTAKGVRKMGPIAVRNVDLFHYVMAIANICLVHLFLGMWL